MKIKHSLIVILLLSLVFFQFSCQKSGSPFTMNGWQFHERDTLRIADAIRNALDYRVNLFIFSHGLFRSVEDFLASPEWQRDILYLGDLADERNIPYYLWIHEFDDIPDKFKVDQRAYYDPQELFGFTGKRVDFDHPELFSYLEERYNRLLDAVPNTAGFVLTFHESDNKIFRNTEVKSKLRVPERTYRICKLIYDVAKNRNKELIIRNFYYEPLEKEFIYEAWDRLPDDIIAMSKTTFHEFDPFYPPDAIHGNVGNKRQIIEIDLGVEKVWSRRGAYAQVEYIQRYVRRAQEKGLTGMVGRARLGWDKPFEDMHEINLYALSRFMEDPSLSVDEVYRDWAQARYPRDAVPHIVSALKRTQDIGHHGRWHLGLWLVKEIGAQWGDYQYYFGHLMLRSRYKWSHDLRDKELEWKLYFPDREIYNKLLAEKDEVLRQIKASMADLEKAEPYLSPEQMESLREDFAFLLDAGQCSREWTQAYFAQRLYVQEPTAEHRKMAEEALAKLEALDQAPGITYGRRNSQTNHRYNIDKFVEKMRWRMDHLEEAITEDNNILDRVRRLMDVAYN